MFAFFFTQEEGGTHAIMSEFAEPKGHQMPIVKSYPENEIQASVDKAVFKEAPKIYHKLPLCYTQNMAVLFRD